jgi:perosamine synthetase
MESVIKTVENMIPFGRPLIGEKEREVVLEALSSSQLVHGPFSQQFESMFAQMLGPGISATSVSSCTAGLHLAYLHFGIGPGDEVIVPAQTHVATAHAVEITGAKPVFVDCDESGNIDVNKIEEYLTINTKAICVVHYPGLPVQMDRIMEIAKSKKLVVIEDCALAIGGSFKGKPCGTIGDVGCFSFYPAKHMTTGEGGMVVSRDPKIIESISNIKSFGYDKSASERKIPGIYDIKRLGINYRMSEIAAAIGTVQLEKITGFSKIRDKNVSTLRKLLLEVKDIRLLPDGDRDRKHANYCLVVVLEKKLSSRRNEIVLNLLNKGIGTSVYYPVPLPLTSYYVAKYGGKPSDFLNSKTISDSSIAFPIGPHLGEADMVRIVDTFKQTLLEIK